MGVSSTVVKDHGNLSFLDGELVVQLEQPVSKEVTIHPGFSLGLVFSGQDRDPLEASEVWQISQ